MTLQQSWEIAIPEDQVQDIWACARERGVPPQEIIRIALENELAR